MDLQQQLVKRAMELGVEVKCNARVVGMDFDVDGEEGDGKKGPKKASVTTSSGTSYVADLIVGADGLWSTCRSFLLSPPSPSNPHPEPDPPLPTGDLAFRIVLDIEDIEDPELRKMVQEPAVRFWIGPHSHVVAYSMRGGTMYNVVLLVPDDLPESVSRMQGNVAEMRALFSGWDGV